MNPEQIIALVEKAIRNRPKTAANRFYIVYREGQVLCLPPKQLTPRERTFGMFNNDTLEKGLQSSQWYTLGIMLNKVMTLEKEKCQPSKPSTPTR